MRSQSIEWITEDAVYVALATLQSAYEEDPLCIINYNPIGYVLQLEAVSNFFDDDVLLLAATIVRSIIQGHPLQDGNKRLGMVLGTYFLALNGFSLTASDEDYFETAIGLASGRIDERRLLDWIRECAVSVEEA